MKEANSRQLAERLRLAPATDLFDDALAAAYVGVEQRTIRDWRATRGLPHLKLTHKVVRYRRSDIDAWLDTHRVAIVR